MASKYCPCGSGKPYADFCQPFITGESKPSSPVALMRSRFTAFSLKEADYLVRTLAAEKVAEKGGETSLRKELYHTMIQVAWLGLKVMDTDMDGPDRGIVEFAAFFDRAGRLGQLHERSRFIKEGGEWV